MTQTEKIKSEIARLQDKLKVLEEAEKKKSFKEIKYKNKTFRLYLWKNKPIGDLKVDGFEIAKFKDLIELYDNDKIELEILKPVFVKHFSKKQQKKEYRFSRVYLDNDLDLYSFNDYLAGSNEDGRVLMVEVKK